MTKYLELLALGIFFALSSWAAGPQDWKKAFKDAKVMEGESVNVNYFENCQVPGEGKDKVAPAPPKEPESDKFDIFYTETGEETDALKLERYKENLDHYTRQAAETEKSLKALGPDADESDKEELEMELLSMKAMIEATEELIAEVKENIKAKNPAAAAEEVKEEKKEEKKEAAKEEPKDNSAPGKNPTHAELTAEYYKVSDLVSNAVERFKIAKGTLQIGDAMDHIKFSVYLVTDPKMWKSLKREGKLNSPARNVDWDLKSRSVLLFASPAIRAKLPHSLNFAIASLAFEQKMKIVNPKGEASDLIERGFAFHVSGLDAVVDLNKVFSLPAIKEKDLLLMSELVSPTRMNDPKRCLCFARQSAAVVRFFMKHGKFLSQYLKNVQGGNSGFRNSFQFMDLNEHWADSYDEFCNNVSTRLFFPLTETAKDDTAYSEWKQSLQDEDKEERDKAAIVQRRKETRDRRHAEYDRDHTSRGQRIRWKH